MSLFTIHDSPGRAPEAIADRLSWSAFLVTPLHALHHGLWLMLLVWMLVSLIALTLGTAFGAGAGVMTYLLLALWLGFEAPSFRRRALGRRGLPMVGDIVAGSAEAALVTYLRR